MIDYTSNHFSRNVDLIKRKIGTAKVPSDMKISFNEPDYNSLNPSVHVWFESPKLIAHIALWHNHTGEFSAIDILKDETLFDYSCEIKDMKEALEHIDRVFELL